MRKTFLFLFLGGSSVPDGVCAAVGGEGEESSEEAGGVRGRSAPVQPHGATGEPAGGGVASFKTNTCVDQLTGMFPPVTMVTKHGEKGLNLPFVFLCLRSWRTVWFSLWLDVPSPPAVSPAHFLKPVVMSSNISLVQRQLTFLLI